MSPQVVAAIIALAGVILSTIVSYFVARSRLHAERRLEIAAHRTIRKLLKQTRWRIRTFSALKYHLPGFTDDELRKLFVAAGAVAFRRRKDGAELWGLVERNAALLIPEQDDSTGGPPRNLIERQLDRIEWLSRTPSRIKKKLDRILPSTTPQNIPQPG